MSGVLWAAGIYNLLWGAFVVLFPQLPFQWAGMAPINYPEIWQCVGMIVGVYGVGYIIAARDPFRHWPIIFVGLLGKVLGPIGMADAIFRGRLPLEAGWTCVTNDLIWWGPFIVILYRAYMSQRSSRSMKPR
ncbi:MAG: alkyl hydroperoxide reductase [Verrucomicrobiaceae bacterium]|nr:MAG: alkyl hydroperoxide reductase [Verrucomicrobiaceae bacterium]